MSKQDLSDIQSLKSNVTYSVTEPLNHFFQLKTDAN